MGRGFLIGLFASAALTLVVCKLVEGRRAAAEAPPAAARPEPAASIAPDPAAELARLRTENEGLSKDIAEAKAAQAKAAEAAAAAAAAEKTPNPWKKLASRLMAYIKSVKENPKGDRKQAQKEMQEVMIEMMGLMGTIGKQYDVTINDAMMTPDGLPALIMAALEDADPPLTASEREALAKAMANASAGWDDYVKSREGKTLLEQRCDLTRRGFASASEFAAAVIPEHADIVTTMQAFGSGLMQGIGGGHYSTTGPREKIRQDFAGQWAKTLKLEPSQSTQLEPIVEDYLRACDTATADITRDIQAGRTDAQQQAMLKRMEAQIAAQKRIGNELSLTEEQKKALSNWTTTYTYWDAPATDETKPK